MSLSGELQELTQKRAYEEQQADIEKQAEFDSANSVPASTAKRKAGFQRTRRLLRGDAVLIQDVDQLRKIHVSLGTEQRAVSRRHDRAHPIVALPGSGGDLLHGTPIAPAPGCRCGIYGAVAGDARLAPRLPLRHRVRARSVGLCRDRLLRACIR